VIVAGQVQDAMEEKHLQFDEEGVSGICGLTLSGFDGDRQITAQSRPAWQRGGSGERQHIGRLVAAAKRAIQATNLPIGGEQDGNFTFQVQGFGRLSEKCGERPPPQRAAKPGLYRGFDEDHDRARGRMGGFGQRAELLRMPIVSKRASRRDAEAMPAANCRGQAHYNSAVQGGLDQLRFRLAEPADAPRLTALIEASVRGLQAQDYSPSQIDQALGTWLGLDTQLIADGTYFVAELIDEPGVLVACGGWSRRKTPYGSDHRPERDDALLDPRKDAAKIRAFFVDPGWARRGIGSRILALSEEAARREGFTRCEMGATLTGVPLYRRHGYAEQEQVQLPLANGESLPIVRMTREM
jgi:GNAT superfamily N-acetyltransferase